MLPHLNVNGHRYIPSLDQLRKQARFLRDHCNVQLNHAYEMVAYFYRFSREGANKQVISSQADSLIKISRIWADFFPANTSNQPI
ncbi:Uncharacterised protein [Klebsiella pneumoniae]|nr:Uncharacterised protein [Klebsiella pneumoniae]